MCGTLQNNRPHQRGREHLARTHGQPVGATLAQRVRHLPSGGTRYHESGPYSDLGHLCHHVAGLAGQGDDRHRNETAVHPKDWLYFATQKAGKTHCLAEQLTHMPVPVPVVTTTRRKW